MIDLSSRRVRTVSLAALLIAPLIPFAVIAFLFLRPKACDYEQVYGSPHFQVPGSDWVLDLWDGDCGFGINLGLELRAENKVTKESRTVLAFLDNTSDVIVSSDSPKTLVVTMPNRSDFNEVDTHLGDVKIVYRFMPEDDPEDRRNFQNWHRHPGDPAARDWYCANILPKFSASDRPFNNQFWGKEYPAISTPSGLYCAH